MKAPFPARNRRWGDSAVQRWPVSAGAGRTTSAGPGTGAGGQHHRLVFRRAGQASVAVASALNNLGVRLSALGEPRPAHETTSEAVTLYRALAADNPAHQPDLASALNNLGADLCELGEHNDEFRFRREALKLFEVLAERDADLYGAGYRHALADLQTVYVRHGQEDRAARLGIPPKPRAPKRP